MAAATPELEDGIDAAPGIERDGDQHRAEHDLPVFSPALVQEIEQRLLSLGFASAAYDPRGYRRGGADLPA